MSSLFATSKRLPEGRGLDFDIETRKVGFHVGGRFNPDGCEPVAIAWKWLDEPGAPTSEVTVRTMTTHWSRDVMREMLEEFSYHYNAASLVTGHYIRKFDLPILSGMMLEFDLPDLSRKLALDTKLDLKLSQGLSKSQENLSDLLKLERSKFHMNDTRWREVARLTDYGLTDARVRVRDDVLQHEQLYFKLVAAGRLDPPRMWGP